MNKYGPKAQEKVERSMKEFKKGRAEGQSWQQSARNRNKRSPSVSRSTPRRRQSPTRESELD